MGPSNPFHSLFFRYRKRKQISIDGHTPGLEYEKRHRGNTHAPSTGHAAQHNRDEYEALNHAEQYHPGRRFYSAEGPGYRTPPGWHETSFAETPPIRSPGHPSSLPPPEPEIDHDLAGWLLRRFVNEASDARASGTPSEQNAADILHLFDPNRTVQMTIGEIHRHMAAQRAYAQSVLAGEIIDEFAGGYVAGPSAEDIFNSALTAAAASLEQAAAAMNALEPAPPEFGDSAFDPAADELETLEQAFGAEFDAANAMFDQPQQMESLDDLVEQQWNQMNAMAMMEPFDQFAPGPPGMPMDPFGGMGSGF